jgi:hypothetical protein
MHEASRASSTRHDFDFLFGSWRVHHHRLDRRLAGCTDWSDFEGRSTARPLLDRLANIDENVIELPSGRYEAATVRTFDEKERRWSIYWIDGRDPKIDTPMQGGFADGVGTFFGDDTFDGVPILVRFLWTGITATSANWEQAFSTDGGTSWETNWAMRFERVS